MNQQKIAIVTDSCADIPAHLAKKYHIHVVPLRLTYHDGEFWDGIDITPNEVYRRLPNEIPKTSLPSGERIEKLLDTIRGEGYKRVLAIHFSSGLSGTYNMMRVMGEAYEGLEVVAFDTLSGCLGTGATVLQTARYLEQGHTWEELLRAIPRLIAHTKVFFALDTLEYLQKGGRIGKITAVAGTLLQIKPIITFSEDGQLTSIAKVRGRKQSIERMIALTVAQVPTGAAFNLAVAHGNSAQDLKTIRTALKKKLPGFENLWEGEIDCTLGAYVGPHLVGVGLQLLPEHIFEKI